MSEPISQQVKELFERNPSVKFSRTQVMERGQFPLKNRIAAFAALKTHNSNGVIKRIGRGVYVLAPAREKVEAATQETKRKYVRKEVVLGDTRDVIVYLNHARTAMKNKESAEYMLVSLALFTLQGKM